MTLFRIMLSINVIDISRQTIYGTYLNENFCLIKINKPYPKINNDTSIIKLFYENYIYKKFIYLNLLYMFLLFLHNC